MVLLESGLQLLTLQGTSKGIWGWIDASCLKVGVVCSTIALPRRHDQWGEGVSWCALGFILSLLSLLQYVFGRYIFPSNTILGVTIPLFVCCASHTDCIQATKKLGQSLY